MTAPTPANDSTSGGPLIASQRCSSVTGTPRALSGVRDKPITMWPSLNSDRQSCRPINPVAPVTRIFIVAPSEQWPVVSYQWPVANGPGAVEGSNGVFHFLASNLGEELNQSFLTGPPATAARPQRTDRAAMAHSPA